MRMLAAVIFAMTMLSSPIRAEQLAFDFPAPPEPARLRSVSLWSTQYLVHAATARPANSDTVELRRRDGTGTGLSLRRDDWCRAVMEGTVAVTADGTIRTFNVDGMQEEPQADCAAMFRHTEAGVLRRLSRQVFVEVSGARVYGLGVNGYRLVPYRTVAADPKVLQPGTALYIAGLRGRPLQLPDGTMAKHDGYVFVGDKGGSITGNHIDFFTGIASANPAPAVVTSDSRRPFDALVVTDAAILSSLRDQHLKR